MNEKKRRITKDCHCFTAEGDAKEYWNDAGGTGRAGGNEEVQYIQIREWKIGRASCRERV